MQAPRSLVRVGILAASSLALVVAAIAASPIALPSRAATLQNRSASCAGFAFQPLDSITYSGYTNAGIRYGATEGGGSGIFVCDPKLPNHARVTSVRFVLWDSTRSGEIEGCGLYRTATSQTGAPTILEMGVTAATGIDARPGRAVVADTTIASATVNTSAWGYWLQCQVHFPTNEGRRFDAGIISAHVFYRADPSTV